MPVQLFLQHDYLRVVSETEGDDKKSKKKKVRFKVCVYFVTHEKELCSYFFHIMNEN